MVDERSRGSEAPVVPDTDGPKLQIKNYRAHTELTVMTRTGSWYSLLIIDPEVCTVYVSGGIFGHEPVEGIVIGSIAPFTLVPVHWGWIVVGYTVAIQVNAGVLPGDESLVLTSPVVSIEVEDEELKPSGGKSA
jgi:hypothetical protein